MKRFLKWLWCALRSHPYPREFDGGTEAYQDWLSGNDPFCPEMHCANCGAHIKHRRGGMGS